MAYINKNDFSIVRNIHERVVEDYFECDDLIAPAISLLNKKGYKTTASCSGHSYPIMRNNLSSKKPEEPIWDLNDIVLVEGSEYCNVIGDDKYFESYKVDNNMIKEYPYHIIYKDIYYTDLYVNFDNIYEFSDIPEKLSYVIYLDHTSSISENIRNSHVISNCFEEITRVYEINKLFYEWVEKLPNLNKGE